MAEGGAARRVDGSFEVWPLELGGIAVLADRAGVALLEVERTLIVSDLHMEKGTALSRGRRFLPPYDTRTTLRRLAQAIERLRPRTVIALGDSFHDVGGAGRLCAEDREALAALQKRREWIWIAGNHDPDLPAALGGEHASEVRLGGLVLRHEPGGSGGQTRQGKFEIAGHLHPCAKVSRGGNSQRRPCFAFGGGRLVLPAFGAYAGGLNVLDIAFAELFPDELAVGVIGRSGVYPVPHGHLRAD